MGQAAAEAHADGEFRLLKNDQDGRGNVYEAQENYEAIAASGWALWTWRVSLVLLFPLVVLTRLGILLLILLALIYFAAAGIVYLLAAPLVKSRRRLRRGPVWRGLDARGRTRRPDPIWLESVVLWLAHGDRAAGTIFIVLIRLTIFAARGACCCRF